MVIYPQKKYKYTYLKIYQNLEWWKFVAQEFKITPNELKYAVKRKTGFIKKYYNIYCYLLKEPKESL
jgi:hypothetical protein